MAFSSAFQERLQNMEDTRNQRLSLLQAEKDLQAIKSQMLESKLLNIRSMEQRCLLLERHIAFQRFKILELNSEILNLDSKYQRDLQQLNVLKRGMQELEESEKEKERFYDLKFNEMKSFRDDMERFVQETQIQVNELKNQANELKSIFVKLQGKDGYLSNSEIAAAEMRKAELVAKKEELEKKLESNYQIQSRLQYQLQHSFNNQDQRNRKSSPFRARR